MRPLTTESRVRDLEAVTPTVRQGIVASLSPLKVYVGGSDVAVEARALNGDHYAVNDKCALLQWRGDLLVIGKPTATPSVVAGEYAASAYRATQTVTDGAWNLVGLSTSEDFDYGGLHSTGTNPERFTAPVDGIYQVNATVLWQADIEGQRYLALQRNGSELFATVDFPLSATNWRQNCGGAFAMSAGQYAQAAVYQNSGDNLNLQWARVSCCLVRPT